MRVTRETPEHLEYAQDGYDNRLSVFLSANRLLGYRRTHRKSSINLPVIKKKKFDFQLLSTSVTINKLRSVLVTIQGSTVRWLNEDLFSMRGGCVLRVIVLQTNLSCVQCTTITYHLKYDLRKKKKDIYRREDGGDHRPQTAPWSCHRHSCPTSIRKKKKYLITRCKK